MNISSKVPTMLLQLLPFSAEASRRQEVRSQVSIALQKKQQFEELENLYWESRRAHGLWVGHTLFGIGLGLIIDVVIGQPALVMPLLLISTPLIAGWFLGKREDRCWNAATSAAIESKHPD